ncbi:DUF1588 domain-containing protein [Akkermansiaceae bacterium]|nr:DUF1588 domain-containing protein [Akkermansiaceae bacterium]
MRSLLITTTLIQGVCSFAAGQAVPVADAAHYEFRIPAKMADLLDFNCYECHDSGTKKGGIQLDNLAGLGQQERLDLLNNVLEQVYSGEMPPKKADQPTETERDELAAWIWGELKIFNASKLEDKLRYYKYANLISHEKLFGGEIKEAPYTRSRRWRVNELIYHERINDVFELEGRARRDSFFGVVKPFNLPTSPGVAYYDTEIVEGGQFLTLMSNAKWIVEKQLRDALEKSGKYQYPAEFLQVKKDNPRGLFKRFPDEAWNPGKTAEPFAAVIRSNGTPADDLLENAITHQFEVALQRAPDDAEMAKYLGFMKSTMSHSDTVSALKKMMVSVLMEPEFLYRNEFGGGEPDEHGRTKLTPREASYAISYALTDRIPDAALVEAAKTGKLETREDYEREVRRILADDLIAKPRILRFFQDYFGYKGIFNVFKDEERFGGAYNPHRVVSTRYIYRVPGKISGEADTLVKWILEQDKDVLKTLLTTDRFFVDHNGNNAEMAERAKKTTAEFARNRLVYKTLKDLKNRDWGDALLKLDKQYPEMKVTEGFINKEGKQSRHLGLTMKQARLYFGEDGTKDENTGRIYPPRDGEAVDHSAQMYNIDPRNWNYQPEQPFKVENRIGMLTHPAWLTAFSHNAATDPVVRGKWVREKLLGGFIRDVPITVDAKVPEDPHSTLRERFAVTEDKKCWMCHEKMNPLGYTFESYDDFGRFRTEEAIEYPENIVGTKTVTAKDSNGIWQDFKLPVYKTKPVNPLGHLDGTGDKTLDGEIKDVPDLMNRLAQSDRVRQVFVRNVFRYFMGRNETLSDSPTLIEADRVYIKSGGSFRELMVSILTSDSFIHRK